MDLVFQKNTQDCRVFEGRFNYNWKFSKFVYVRVIKLDTSSSSDEAEDSADSPKCACPEQKSNISFFISSCGQRSERQDDFQSHIKSSPAHYTH